MSKNFNIWAIKYPNRFSEFYRFWNSIENTKEILRTANDMWKFILTKLTSSN